MSTTVITTNHQARPMLAWSEIPADDPERPELDFGADPDAEGQYFRAYGRWHTLFDFILIKDADPASPLAEWEAIKTESLGTGIVIRYATAGYEHDPYGYVIVGFVITKGI